MHGRRDSTFRRQHLLAAFPIKALRLIAYACLDINDFQLKRHTRLITARASVAVFHAVNRYLDDMPRHQLLGSDSRALFRKIMAVEKSLALLQLEFIHHFVAARSVNYYKAVSVGQHFNDFLCHKSRVRTLFVAGELGYAYDRAVIGSEGNLRMPTKDTRKHDRT